MCKCHLIFWMNDSQSEYSPLVSGPNKTETGSSGTCVVRCAQGRLPGGPDWTYAWQDRWLRAKLLYLCVRIQVRYLELQVGPRFY